MRAQISRLSSVSSRSVPSMRLAPCAAISAATCRRRGTGRAPRSMRCDSELAHQRRELALEPCAHRRAEAALLALQDVRAAARRQRLLHHVLQPPAADLHVLRHARGELHQLVIEQRHAAFQRHRHAHLVGQQQQIVGQLRLRVDRTASGSDSSLLVAAANAAASASCSSARGWRQQRRGGIVRRRPRRTSGNAPRTAGRRSTGSPWPGASG